MTAMLDAIGRFVTEIGEHLASQKWTWDRVKA